MPRPNRPRSALSLVAVGLWLPGRIAFSNSVLVMPLPSSTMAKKGVVELVS